MNTPQVYIQPRISADDSIGNLLLQAGKIRITDVQNILSLQNNESLRFGEAAVKLGLVSEEDISRMLADQFDYTYLVPGEGGFSPELVCAYRPFTQPAEKIRILRNQLISRWFGNGKKTLSILGAGSGVGTSYITANLAVAFAQLGQRTLLIDANLHSPRQHQIFNLDNRAGLASMLAGRADMSSIVKIQSLSELSVLPAGAMPPNPAELISRGMRSKLMSELGQHYDVILIDTPAFAEHAESASLAIISEGSILVAGQDRTKYHDLEQIRDTLNGTNAQLIGTVFNQA
ncbi:MAG: chain length determinant protein tyrosine kinase EpsG [Sulfuriferula sp.]|nr:chain length determinant protein tyrosine kinase EpsG [Sulfuriferula sp.]